MVTLHYHPFTRASNVVWMLEEVGIDYELRFVVLMKGEHKRPEVLALARWESCRSSRMETSW